MTTLKIKPLRNFDRGRTAIFVSVQYQPVAAQRFEHRFAFTDHWLSEKGIKEYRHSEADYTGPLQGETQILDLLQGPLRPKLLEWAAEHPLNAEFEINQTFGFEPTNAPRVALG